VRIGRFVTTAVGRLRARFGAVLLLSVLSWAGSVSAGTGVCTGDCNGDGKVTIDELVFGTHLALATGVADCTAIDADGDESVTIDELVLAVDHALGGCPTLPTPTPSGLGTRRFSIEASSSPLVAVLRQGEVVSSLPGFSGFLELTAGEPSSGSGLAFIDVTDASEFIAIDVPDQGTALCIKPIRRQLPVVRAGFVACAGGFAVGLRVRQDHRVGEVGRCAAGARSGEVCTVDEDCGGESCFSVDDCAALGGSVERLSDPHPGVCNGPVQGEPLSDDSGAGAVLILPDPEGGLTRGLPVEIFNEQATPCGDEDVPGMTTEIALTSGVVEVEVANLNDQTDEVSSHQVSGESFSCASWQEEDGRGTLVLGLPGLDVPAVGDQLLDVLTFFVWDD
jgi:hypothetical protein